MMEKRDILDRLETIYRDMARSHDKADYWEMKRDISELLESLQWLMNDIRNKRPIR